MQNTNTGMAISYLLVDTQEEVLQEHYYHVNDINAGELTAKLLDKGYEVVGDLASSGLWSEESSEVTVFVREKESVVTADAPKEAGSQLSFSGQASWPAGVGANDLNRGIYRTVQFLYEDGKQAFPPVRQKIQLKRTAIVNHARQTVSYTDWKLAGRVNEFEAVQVPVISGYLADVSSVPNEAVTDFAQTDKLLTITYQAEAKQATVRVVDLNSNKTLFTDEYTSKTNELISYPVQDVLDTYTAKGYEIVSNELTENQYLSVDGQTNFTVTVQPKVIILDPLEFIPQVGQKVYPDLEDSVVWPEGLEKDKLLREIKRTIQFEYEGGATTQEAHVQTLVFKRRVLINLLESTISYGSWEGVETTFPAYTPREEEGYVAKPRLVPERKGITANSEHRVEKVTYTRTIQKVEVQIVDQSRQMTLLYKTKLIGKSGQDLAYDPQVKIQEFAHNGYELVYSEFPENGTFGHESGTEKVYQIVLQPKVVTVYSTDPKPAGGQVGSDTKGPWWPAGVDKVDLLRKVERTIHYLFPDDSEALPTTVDSVVFSRDAQVNLVTGQVTYSDWDFEQQELPEQQVPEILGYYSDKDHLPAIPRLSAGSSNISYTIRYLPHRNPVWVTVYDSDREEPLAQRQTFNRDKEDLTQELRHLSMPFIEKGYRIKAADQQESYHFDLENDQVSVTLEPVVKVVTVEKPRLAYTPIEGYDRLTWPKGLEVSNLQKVISRTVYFQTESGQEVYEPIVQHITFNREAHVRLTDSHVSYSVWKGETDQFKAIEVPTYPDHTSSKERIEEMTVDGYDYSQVITVTYRKNPEPIRVRYINQKTQEEVAVDKIVGRVSETYYYELEKRYLALDLAGYEIVGGDYPHQLVITDQPQEFTVYLAERVVEVHWQDPKEAFTLLELGNGAVFSWPSGLDLSSLSYESQRHIHYNYENKGQAHETIVQRCLFYRNAFVNLVTSEVSYGDWQPEMARFDAVTSPELPGYEVTRQEVGGVQLSAKGEPELLEEYVIYKENPYQFEVKVFDILNNQELETLYFVIRAGEKPAYQLDRLVGHYIKQGYELVETRASNQQEIGGAGNHVNLLLKPRFVTLTVEDLQDGFQNIEQPLANKLKYLSGVGLHDLSRTIKRTIKYIYQDGEPAAADMEAVVTYSRQVTINMVNGELAYSDWYSPYPTFDEVINPLIHRYQASQETSPSVDYVSVDDGDVVEYVIYSPMIQEVVVNIINKATGDILYSESLPELAGFDKEGISKDAMHSLMQKAIYQEPSREASPAATAEKPVSKVPSAKPAQPVKKESKPEPALVKEVAGKGFIGKLKDYLFSDKD